MNSTKVINIARKGEGFKGWYLNKTLGGKCVLRRALAKQYGKRKDSFENGVAKYEKKIPNGVETRYIGSKLKPFLTKLTKFGESGRKVSEAAFYQNPNNPRQKTNLLMNDYPKFGKRVYTFNRLSYNVETNGWKVDYREQTTMKYNDSEIKVKSVINDFLNNTRNVIEKTFPKKVSES